MRGAKPEASIEQAIERDGVIRRGERVLDRVQRRRRFGRARARAATRAQADGSDAHACARQSRHARIGVARRMRGAAHRRDVWLAGTRRRARRRAIATKRRCAMRVTRRSSRSARSRRRERRRDRAPSRGSKRNGPACALARRRSRRAAPACRRAVRSRRGVDLARPLLRIAAEELRYACHVHALAVRGRSDQRRSRPAPQRRCAPRSRRCARSFPASTRPSREPPSCWRESAPGRERADLRREVRARARGTGRACAMSISSTSKPRFARSSAADPGRFHMKKGVELRIEHGHHRGPEIRSVMKIAASLRRKHLARSSSAADEIAPHNRAAGRPRSCAITAA